MIVPKVYPHRVVRIVATVIFSIRATIVAIPHIVVPIDFSSAPGAPNKTSIGATNMLDRFSNIKILIVFRVCQSLHVETSIQLS